VSAILFLRKAVFSDLFRFRGIGYKGISKPCHKIRSAKRLAEFREARGETRGTFCLLSQFNAA
jgi:hypothetical protein